MGLGNDDIDDITPDNIRFRLKQTNNSISNFKSNIVIHLPTPITKIQNIMGANFHGEESLKKLKISLNESEGKLYSSIDQSFLDRPLPFNRDMKISEGCVLVVIPCSETINSLHDKINHACVLSGKSRAFHECLWKRSESFAISGASSNQIYLIPKEVPEDSLGCSFDESFNSSLVKSKLSVAGARELVCAIGLQWLVSEERIYANQARTKDHSSSGGRVAVGKYDAQGAYIEVSDDKKSYKDIGVGLCWKS